VVPGPQVIVSGTTGQEDAVAELLGLELLEETLLELGDDAEGTGEDTNELDRETVPLELEVVLLALERLALEVVLVLELESKKKAPIVLELDNEDEETLLELDLEEVLTDDEGDDGVEILVDLDDDTEEAHCDTILVKVLVEIICF
jgi:hypothetical protein